MTSHIEIPDDDARAPSMRVTRRPCLDCGVLCTGSRCPACQRARDQRRGSAAERGYDAAWRQLRAEQLDREPWCQRCGQVATEVDHIVRLRMGGGHDPSNLQSLCGTCHRRKTAVHDGGYGRSRRVGNTLRRTSDTVTLTSRVRPQVSLFWSYPGGVL